MYVLGLDLGTSSLKGILFHKKGELLGESSAEYPLLIHELGYSEQNPSDWIVAVKKIFSNLLGEFPDMREKLVGISFSGQMHGLVLMDEQNEVIRPAILWNDVRTTKQCQKIEQVMDEKYIAITKNIALEGFTLPKILWVQENEPDNWKNTNQILLPKDYLTWWFTGNYSTDFSDAAGTLLLDIENGQWSQEILDAFQINNELLPDLHFSTSEVGIIKKELLEFWGFSNPVKIFAGGADNACAALGAGIIDEKRGMVSIGTSGVVLSLEKSSTADYKGKIHIFNHVIKNNVFSLGCTLSAGNSLSWFKKNFAPHQTFDELLDEASKVNIGSDNLLFTPYITGERAPYIDSQIRGSFIGIDIHHGLKHFTRAVLEGITFSLKDSQILMENSGVRLSSLISVGGGAKNKDWLQMQADIFNATIITLENEQGPGIGAAMLAALGCGFYKDVEACVQAFVHYEKEIHPIEENVAKYAKVYSIYQKVYNQTSEICHDLMKL